VDGLSGPVTYSELSQCSERLARVLLDLGFEPLDRIIVQLPNTAVFAYLYFALQRIGAAPVLALPGTASGRSASSPRSPGPGRWPE